MNLKYKKNEQEKLKKVIRNIIFKSPKSRIDFIGLSDMQEYLYRKTNSNIGNIIFNIFNLGFLILFILVN